MSGECPVAAAARRSPEAPALVFGEARWSYAALNALVSRWVRALAAEGVGPGMRVATLAANRPELVAVLFAVRRLGATLVPLNARLSAVELAPLVARVAPRLVLADAGLVSRVAGACAFERPCVDGMEPAPDEGPGLGADAPWLVLFTSGTTGAPKAAELTVGNLEANARLSAVNLGAEADQRWLGTLPLFHIGGLAMAVRCAVYGATLVLAPRFDAREVRSLLWAERITHASLVAQTLAALLDAEPSPLRHTLRAVLLGGGPVAPGLLARARAAGLPVLMTYGLTEATSQVCTERTGEADGATVGLPLPELEVRVVDADRTPVPLGQEGEIEVRGPTVMRGYLDDAPATAAALSGGWLRTRDLGVLDGRGRLTVLARRTDLILSGGENIYPAELEAALMDHPLVAEAAVVGSPDARWGEVPVAFFVPKPGPGPAAEALHTFCRGRLAGFKVPKRFEPLQSLPRNAMGKVDRAGLKARAAELFSTKTQSPQGATR